jgi:hypothetical protein
MGSDRSSKTRLICIAGIILFSVVCYGSIISSYFLSDDFTLIGRVAREGMYWQWGEDTGGFLRPVTVLSFLSDHVIWGFDPAGFHLTNILFHGMVGSAVFLISLLAFKEWGLTEGILPAFLTACVFVALPSHSEPVSWISGRTDLMASAFGLLSVYTFMLLLRRRSRLLLVLTIALFMTGVLAKESALFIPAVWLALAIAYRITERKFPSVHSRWAIASSAICMVIYFIARKILLGHFVGGLGTKRHLAIFSGQALENLGRFALRIFLPPFSHQDGFLTIPFAFLLGAAILAFILIVQRKKIQLKKRAVHLILLGICFFLSLVTVITMKVSITSTQSERFLYFPSAFAVILLCSLIALIPGRKVSAVVLIVLAVLGFVFLQQVNTRWQAAGRLSLEITQMISNENPDSILILNLPDNFQGAYVLRNGMAEAVTLFQGREARGEFRILCTHGVNSLTDTVRVLMDDEGLVLTLPQHWEFTAIDSTSFDLSVEENVIHLREPDLREPDINSFLLFDGREMTRMVRQ